MGLGFVVGLNRSPVTRSLFLDWMTPGIDLLRGLSASDQQWPKVALVAEAQGRLVGFVGLDAHPDRGPSGIEGERAAIRLLGPVVKCDYRRRGIGSLLLRRALSAAKVHYSGDRLVCSAVDEVNPAGKMLVRQGFCLGRREHCMVMTAPLPEARIKDSSGVSIQLCSGTELADVKRIYPVYRSAWQGRKTQASFANDICHPPGALWWLEHSGSGVEVIAFLQHIARPDRHDNIEYVAVHERFRSQGHGSHFLELALAALWRDPRLRSLRLSTAEDNLPALRLYLKMGFRRRFLLRCYESPLRVAARGF